MTDSGTLQASAEIGELRRRIAELEEVVGSQEERLDGLLRIAANLTSSREPKKAMKVIVDDISKLMRASRTTIYELCREERLLKGLAVKDPEAYRSGSRPRRRWASRASESPDQSERCISAPAF